MDFPIWHFFARGGYIMVTILAPALNPLTASCLIVAIWRSRMRREWWLLAMVALGGAILPLLPWLGRGFPAWLGAIPTHGPIVYLWPSGVLLYLPGIMIIALATRSLQATSTAMLAVLLYFAASLLHVNDHPLILLSLNSMIAVSVLRWSSRARRSTPASQCARCGYDLRGLPPTASKCPECGLELRHQDSPRDMNGVKQARAEDVAISPDTP